MGWVRLDDKFPRHPKVIQCGLEARWLYVASLCHCNEFLTDGSLTAGDAISLATRSTGPRRAKTAIAELVKAGLWIRDDPGNYQVHDYLRYNNSREQVVAAMEDKHEAKVRAGRAGGLAKASNALADANSPATDLLLAKGKQKLAPTQPNPTQRENIEPNGSHPEPSSEQAVFTAWRQSTGRIQTRLTTQRMALIRARRKEGYTQDDLLDAVRGWANDPWEGRQQQNDLGILLRSGAQVEKFRDLFRAGKPPIKPQSQAAKNALSLLTRNQTEATE
jgi:hypothetical protein